MADAEVFRLAAEHLVRYGWVQGQEGTPRRRTCALGVLFAVTGNWKTAYRLATRIETEKRLGHGVLLGERLTEWNDKRGRKAHEVVGLFKEMASA